MLTIINPCYTMTTCANAMEKMPTQPRVPWPKTNRGVFFLIVASIIIGGVFLFLGMVAYYSWQLKYGDAAKLAETFAAAEFTLDVSRAGDAITPVSTEMAAKTIRPANPSTNDAKTAITILAFIDFECPYSQKSYAVFKKIMETYKPVARAVFKHFPLQDIHPDGQNASLAAACAHEQGKFWPYYDALFSTRQFDEASLFARADELKLDPKKFTGCYRSRRNETTIEDDFGDGVALGVRGTPTYFVNGRRVEGAITEEQWNKIIAEELKK